MLKIRPRISIAALMGFVCIFGVGLAAFRYPSKLWGSFLNDFLVTRSTSFELIGHALLALLFAYLGGLTASRFAKLGATPASSSASAPV